MRACAQPRFFRHIDPRVAVLAGKLFFSGEMALGVNLGYWLRKAVEQGVAAAAALESATLGVVEADRWERDGDVGVCGGCGQQGVKVSYGRGACYSHICSLEPGETVEYTSY